MRNQSNPRRRRKAPAPLFLFVAECARRGKRRAGSPSTARGGIRGPDGSGDDASGSARHRKRNFGRGSGGDSPTTGAVSTVATTALAVLGLAAIGVAGTAAAALGALDGALELARGAGSALGVAVVAVAGCGEDRRGGDGFISDGTGVRVLRRSPGDFSAAASVISRRKKSHPGPLEPGNPRRQRGRPTRTEPGFDVEQRGERVARYNVDSPGLSPVLAGAFLAGAAAAAGLFSLAGAAFGASSSRRANMLAILAMVAVRP